MSYTSKSKQLFQMNSSESSEEEPAEAQSVWDDVSQVPWYFLKTGNNTSQFMFRYSKAIFYQGRVRMTVFSSHISQASRFVLDFYLIIL